MDLDYRIHFDVMTNLTEGDYEYLASLDIATICDYRSEQERHEEPTRWAAGQVDYVTFPDPASARRCC